MPGPLPKRKKVFEFWKDETPSTQEQDKLIKERQKWLKDVDLTRMSFEAQGELSKIKGNSPSWQAKASTLKEDPKKKKSKLQTSAEAANVKHVTVGTYGRKGLQTY